MSEQEIERVLFDDLSAELEDPALQKTLEEAKRWDEQLRTGDGENEVLRATVKAALAKSWAQWNDKPVTVTGYAHRVLGSNNDIRPDPVLVTPDDDVTSKGFTIVHTDVDGENIHGNPYGAQYRVVHDMHRQVDERGYERLFAFIDNHDVQSDVMSVEYAGRWLERTQPDFLQRLHGSIENARRPETKLVRIGTSAEPGLFLDIFNQKNRAAVESYLNDIVAVDTKVDYLFTTQEGKSVFEQKSKGGQYETINTPLRAIGRFSNIYFQKMKPSAVNNDAGDWWLSVKAKVHAEETSGPDRTIVLPLRSLKNVRSLREYGYSILKHLDKL